MAGDLLRALPYVLRRTWLETRITSAISAAAVPQVGARAVLVTGEPGSGKTVLAAQLATAWRCPCAILRLGSTDSAVAADPKNVLVSLGLQLRARFGPEIFGPPDVEIRGRASAGPLAPHAYAAGVRIGTVRVSPFRRILIDGEVDIADLHGTAVAADVGELRDIVAELSAPLLAQEAVVDPLRRLARLRPGVDVRIVVDGLDESPELTRVLPVGSDGSPNTMWILTSRPGRHLDRLTPALGTEFVRVDIDQVDTQSYRVDDAEHYALARLGDPVVRDALARAPGVALVAEELARTVAVASDGNFLYLYHVLYGLEELATAGRVPPALTGSGGPPEGLDGIYRFLVTGRLRQRAADAWRGSYAPVLGVLAVARASLTSGQLARLAGLDAMTVDDVLAGVEQFIQRVPVPGDSAVMLYHRSFGEFLVTQDRSRNPHPLEPAAIYHRRVAAALDERDANDGYALAHLPVHVAEAGDLDRLAALITGPFIRRQWEALGASAALHTCDFGIRQTANAARDDLLVTLLDRRGTLRDELNDEWDAGRYVLSLLDTAEAVRRRAATGGPVLPWSAFLAAERLLDLGSPEGANALLREAMRRPWPRFRPELPRSFGLGEGSLVDWPDLPLTRFLARIAAIEPELALALVTRLHVNGPNVPNVQSAWRDVLRDFLGGTAPAEAYRRLADVTARWLTKPHYLAGLTGIADAHFAIVARAARSAEADSTWTANAVLRACQVRLNVRSVFNGVPYDNLAAALDGLLSVASAVPDTHLASLLDEGAHGLLDGVAMPEIPQVHRYDGRADGLGRFACVLYRAGMDGWPDAAEAALAACELDASCDDPPADAIAAGLAWLALTADDVRTRAGAIAARHGLVDRVARAAARIADPWPGEPEELSVDALRTAHTTYEAAHMALALWNEGAATRPVLAAALRSRRRDSRTGTRRLRDVAIEALVRLLVAAAASWAPHMIAVVLGARDQESRTQAEIDTDGVRSVRWNSLSAQGSLDLLRAEVSAVHAQQPDDPNAQFDCCLAAVDFDLEIADRWLAELTSTLDPADRGFAIVQLVQRLARAHPGRLEDLGVRWSDGILRPGPSEQIALYESVLCRWWARHPPLDRHVAETLDRFTTVLIGEFERAAAKRDDRGWALAGSLLRAAAAVGDNQPNARAAAARFAAAVDGLRSTRGEEATRSGNDMALLSGFLDDSGGGIVAGPAADIAARLIRNARSARLDAADRPTALGVAALLKKTHPGESRLVFDAAIQALGAEESHPSDLTGLVAAAVRAGLEATSGSPFRTIAERDEYSLAAALAAWCTAPPRAPGDLMDLQRRIIHVDDVDRRATLLAAVAPAWLDLGDLRQARAVSEVSARHLLGNAGYFDRLATLFHTTVDGDVEAIRQLLLDAVADCPSVEPDAAEDILTAWFGLRAREDSGGREPELWFDPDCLRETIRRVVQLA